MTAAGGEDPIDGLDVNPATAQHKRECQGKTSYFSALGCRREFKSDLEKYLDPSHEPSM